MTKRYGTVVGRIEQVIGDSPGDADALPDVVELEGMITFRPTVPVVHYQSVIVQPETVTAMVEASTLTRNDLPSVTLLASVDSGASPGYWAYEVLFDLYTVNGSKIEVPAGQIAVFPDVETSLAIALKTSGPTPAGSFTASPFVWDAPTPPPDPEPGTYWLNTDTGDLKEWRP